jgi:predicted Zn finger-like uncharacterized protein
VKFACMSCGAKYSVPDGRLHDVGASGLRVRCQRCRAIMVVSASQRFLFEAGSPALHAREDEDTRPHRVQKGQKKRRSEPTTEDGLQIVTSSEADVAPDGMPAALSASGVFRPLPGVNRQVTGFFFPELEELKHADRNASARVWYVAIGTRTRGPFAASEVVTLAEKGKVRDSTLVWRPGFGTWKRVKDGEAGSVEDLSWLRRVVQQRKVREREAQREAEVRLGIRPVQLTRSSQGPRHVTTGTGPGMPPPLPPPAFDDALADDSSGVLQLSALLEDGPQPFAWRAEPSSSAPRAAGTHARNRSAWLVALCGAVVVGTVAGLLVAAAGAPWARLVASIAFE